MLYVWFVVESTMSVVGPDVRMGFDPDVIVIVLDADTPSGFVAVTVNGMASRYADPAVSENVIPWSLDVTSVGLPPPE